MLGGNFKGSYDVWIEKWLRKSEFSEQTKWEIVFFKVLKSQNILTKSQNFFFKVDEAYEGWNSQILADFQ